jgi:hypothetical protein
MSQRDNESGVRWAEVISTEPNASDFGIICLTSDDLKSTWLNFEAGALGKAVRWSARSAAAVQAHVR